MIRHRTLTGAAAALGCLLAAGPAAATTWYVATTGSDANPGTTASAPFRTWQKGIDKARAGDTVLIAPGTYKVAGSREYGVLVTRSGTPSAPIALRASGGRAVLDCSGLADAGGVYCLHLTNASWWQLSGIDVTGARQRARGDWSLGLYVLGGGNVALDRVAAYANDGPGVTIEGRSTGPFTVRYSDSHDNYDRLASPPGGNADGFDFRATGTVTVTGCRAWNNSDDGFDTYNARYPTGNPVDLTGNWSFRNGYVPGTRSPAGDGVGFKIGAGSPPRNLRRNLAFLNRYAGFDTNAGTGSYLLADDSTYKNGSQEYATDKYGSPTLTDDIAVGDTSWGFYGRQVGNSWQVGGAFPSDFRSLDPTGTAGPRQADGGLPVLPFLRPVAGDRLAGIGAYAGR